MRVLFWSETFWPRVGGVENVAARLLPALRTCGHQFIVVTWENTEVPNQIRYRDIPVFRFPFFSAGLEGSFAQLLNFRHRVARLKKEFAPDLVHVNSYGKSVLFHIDTIGAFPVPTLLSLHQALPDGSIEAGSLLEATFCSANWISSCSASVLAHARRLRPEIIQKSSVIHNAIELTEQEPKTISFNPPRIVCLGRLVPEKGFDLALATFRIVSRRFPDARLIIGGEGPEHDKLRRQTEHLGLIDSVKFAGHIPPDKVAGFLERATLVLVPSRLEGFGLVALEAGAMGRPVIATKVGGLPEIIVHEDTGLLTETENSAALANAVEVLLEDPEKARQMGMAARERVRKEFDWQRHVRAYDALYRQLTKDSVNLTPSSPRSTGFTLL